LFTLDRRDHVEARIKPLLNFVMKHRGFMLLQHRYYLSAAAYQAVGTGKAELMEILAEQKSFAPPPDLFVILDVPVDVALERLERARTPDLFEKRAFLEKVRERYRTLQQIESETCRWVEALGTPDEVAGRIMSTVSGQ
jgi:dTMP kinase